MPCSVFRSFLPIQLGTVVTEKTHKELPLLSIDYLTWVCIKKMKHVKFKTCFFAPKFTSEFPHGNRVLKGSLILQNINPLPPESFDWINLTLSKSSPKHTTSKTQPQDTVGVGGGLSQLFKIPHQDFSKKKNYTNSHLCPVTRPSTFTGNQLLMFSLQLLTQGHYLFLRLWKSCLVKWVAL